MLTPRSSFLRKIIFCVFLVDDFFMFSLTIDTSALGKLVRVHGGLASRSFNENFPFLSRRIMRRWRGCSHSHEVFRGDPFVLSLRVSFSFVLFKSS